MTDQSNYGSAAEFIQSRAYSSDALRMPADSSWPKFGGTDKEDPLDWLDQVEALCTSCRVPEDVVLSKFGIMFTDIARFWYQQRLYRRPFIATWSEWVRSFLERFNRPETWQSVRSRWLVRARFEGQCDPADWIATYVKMHQRVYNSSVQQVITALPTAMDHNYRTEVQHLVTQQAEWTLDDFIPRFEKVARLLRKRYTGAPCIFVE